jgi:hypothetical protein
MDDDFLYTQKSWFTNSTWFFENQTFFCSNGCDTVLDVCKVAPFWIILGALAFIILLLWVGKKMRVF